MASYIPPGSVGSNPMGTTSGRATSAITAARAISQNQRIRQAYHRWVGAFQLYRPLTMLLTFLSWVELFAALAVWVVAAVVTAALRLVLK